MNPIGIEFDNIKIIKHVGKYKGNHNIWECRCSCGNIWNVLQNNLVKSISCKECRFVKRSRKKTVYFCEGINKSFWNKYKRGATLRNIEFNIKPEDLYNLYIKQNKKCNLTGLDINLIPRYSTGSLDRINNELGYTTDNIQLLHKDVNMMKKEFNQGYLIELANKSFQPFYFNTNFNENAHDLTNRKFRNYKIHADKQNIEYNINKDIAWEMFLYQRGLCYISKIPISLYGEKCTASLDRIDSSKGYIPGNVWWVHKDVNRIKGKLDIKKLMWYFGLIKTYNDAKINPNLIDMYKANTVFI